MIWLIGVGLMGVEYAKVLNSIKVDYIAVGRGAESAKKFEEKVLHPSILGGLESFLKSKPVLPDAVIVAVGIEALSSTCSRLLEYGVKKILLEKPGCGWNSELPGLVDLTRQKGADVQLAYNRRFYSSLIKAEEIIKEDGGVTSFNFEFTEWSHTIAPLKKTKVEHNTWFLGNSTHVIDTAFFLGGWPTEMTCYYKGGLGWHPSGSIYTGAGISNKGALFSYQANWEAPGRWAVEILTNKHRLYFKPMETLQIQDIGTVKLNPVEIDDHLDKVFKPGLYLQTKAFLEGDYSRFCTLFEQKAHVECVYNKMSGYTL